MSETTYDALANALTEIKQLRAKIAELEATLADRASELVTAQARLERYEIWADEGYGDG